MADKNNFDQHASQSKVASHSHSYDEPVATGSDYTRISPRLVTVVSSSNSSSSEDLSDGNCFSQRKSDSYSLSVQRLSSQMDSTGLSGGGDAPALPLEAPAVIHVMKGDHFYFDPKIYKMSAKVRGLCLIVNNVVFDDPKFNRPGSEKDGEGLEEVFKQLHFEVRIETNLTAAQMTRFFTKACKDQVREYDCFVAVILTHGWRQNLLYGTDGQFVSLDSLTIMFNNANCPPLINRPKLFFIQSCRGEQLDPGVTQNMSSHVADAFGFDAKGLHQTSLTYTIPTWSDTVICFSTIDGYVSLRNTTTGSWFGDALIKVLCSHSGNTELYGLLNLVNEKLMQREGSSMLKQSLETLYRGWSKSFYFNPGYTDSNALDIQEA